MLTRFSIILYLLGVFTACALIPPPYDEIIPLLPELGEEGNAVLRTQTLWTNNFDTLILQVIQIDSHLVGVKYMHGRDFRKLPEFPQGFSFGKRLFIIPPGNHNIIITYKGESGALLGPDKKEHSGVILYEAKIPADSVCAFIADISNFSSDMYDPDVKLTCRKREFSIQQES